MLNRTDLPEGVRAGYGLAIGGYLLYCQRNAISVTVESARGYMADVQRRQLARNPGLWKNGLNWFFSRGRRMSGWRSSGEPTPGRADTGKTPWERRLIERLRLGHYSWRTEQTYRDWSWRLERFVGAKGVEEATGEHVKSFLSGLAVKGQVAASTQNQAFNNAKDEHPTSNFQLPTLNQRAN